MAKVQKSSKEKTQKSLKHKYLITQPYKATTTSKCWATLSSGNSCLAQCSRDDGIPYCEKCFAKGDQAVRVMDHPDRPDIFGKILVARVDIPKGYKIVYWVSLKVLFNFKTYDYFKIIYM